MSLADDFYLMTVTQHTGQSAVSKLGNWAEVLVIRVIGSLTILAALCLCLVRLKKYRHQAQHVTALGWNVGSGEPSAPPRFVLSLCLDHVELCEALVIDKEAKGAMACSPPHSTRNPAEPMRTQCEDHGLDDESFPHRSALGSLAIAPLRDSGSVS